MTQQAWDERYSQPGRVWSGKVNHWLVDTVSDLTPGTALDLACGEGGDAVWLAQHGWTVTAVDFATAGLARGRTAAAGAGVANRIAWVPADISTWNPPHEYDLVTMHFLHVPSTGVPGDAIRSAWRACAGTALIVAHDRANATHGTAGGPPADVLYGPTDVLGALGISPEDPTVLIAEARRRETEAGRWVDAVVVLRR